MAFYFPGIACDQTKDTFKVEQFRNDNDLSLIMINILSLKSLKFLYIVIYRVLY